MSRDLTSFPQTPSRNSGVSDRGVVPLRVPVASIVLSSQDERWAPVAGYERRYQVSTFGRIRNRKGLILKPFVDKHGYLQVRIVNHERARNFRVHRLVAFAFVAGYEDGLHVNHKDFDKKNNHVENLEWCTNQENIRHAVANGRQTGRPRKHPIVERIKAYRPRRTLPPEILADIHRLRVIDGMQIRAIAAAVGSSKSVIHRALQKMERDNAA